MMMAAASSTTAQWRRVNVPGPANAGYYLDVFFLPSEPRFGWACSIEGFIVRTSDGGLTWQSTQLPGVFLESIQFLDPLRGYTSGPGGIFRSDDGGASWRNITPVNIADLNPWGCYFLTRDLGVWFVGGCANGVQRYFRTTDGGNSWTLTFTTEPNSGLSDGILYEDGTGYAVSSGVLWRTDDFGLNWTLYSRTGAKYWTEEITHVNGTFLLPTSGLDCSGSTEGVGSMRWSSDEGQTWSEFQTGQQMYGAFLIDEQRGWGVGDNGMAIYTEDRGKTWSIRGCGLNGASIDDVWFIDENNGWCVGQGIFRSDFLRPAKFVTITPPERIVNICPGDQLLLETNDSLRDYQWNDEIRARSRFVTQPGDYVITAVDPLTCVLSRDTITVRFYPDNTPVVTSSRPIVCFGETATLSVSGPYRSIRWSTGDTTASIEVGKTMSVTVTTIDTNGCERTSSPFLVTVKDAILPTIATSRSPRFCIGDSVILSAPAGFREYSWSSGETTRSIVVKTSGTFRVTVTDGDGCAGESEEMIVDVIDTKNKIAVEFTSTDGTLDIQAHEVGSQQCRDLLIRNLSDSEYLVVNRPILIGNVTFSIPVGQLPRIIEPSGFAQLTICAAVTDTGMSLDTLILPDTCSPTVVPVRSAGLQRNFSGTSRCTVPIDAVVVRAGASWLLSAPYPIPTDDVITMQIERQGAKGAEGVEGIVRGARLTAGIVDALGRQVETCRIVEPETGLYYVEGNVRSLPRGGYAIIVRDGTGEVISSHSLIRD